MRFHSHFLHAAAAAVGRHVRRRRQQRLRLCRHRRRRAVWHSRRCRQLFVVVEDTEERRGAGTVVLERGVADTPGATTSTATTGAADIGLNVVVVVLRLGELGLVAGIFARQDAGADAAQVSDQLSLKLVSEDCVDEDVYGTVDGDE